MSRTFHPLAVLRHLPADLVRRFCDRHRVPLALSPEAAPEPTAGDLYAAVQALPARPAAVVEQMLLQVHQLATGHGVRQLYEEAAFRGVPFDDPDPRYGPHAVALWCLIHRGGVFHHVLMLDAADRLPGRYWHKVTGLPPVPPDASPLARQRLQRLVADFFHAAQGRGRRVTVEHHLRAGREHYFFCYPDDYTHTHVAHDANGRLARTPVRPTFEVVFAVDPPAGILEVYAPVPRRDRVDLVQRFCGLALNADPVGRPPHDPTYQLDRLLDRSRPLATDPADGVSEVRVAKLLVALPRSGRRVQVRGDPAAPPVDALDLLDDVLPPDRYPRPLLHVTEVTFALRYRRAEDARARTLTFEVSYPDSCTLRAKPDGPRQLGERCLRLWGIARD